ncbi:hypothetical protein WMY93_011027 [Mugilogobius chulae]|uniref:Uncharacterized protein n=1 Tax=Mugilogobius chulae TaxID=88201 RepID=A0AAW0PMC8_9GOBI
MILSSGLVELTRFRFICAGNIHLLVQHLSNSKMEKMSRVTTALSSSSTSGINGITMFCHLDAPANALVCAVMPHKWLWQAGTSLKSTALKRNSLWRSSTLELDENPP